MDITAVPPQPEEATPSADKSRSVRTPYYTQSSNPRPFGEPSANFDFDLSFLDHPVTDLSAQMFATGMTPLADGTTIRTTQSHQQRVWFDANGEDVARQYNNDLKDLVGIHRSPSAEDETTYPSNGDIAILPDIPQGRELVGGWFDPNDVPPAIRDHL